MAKDKRIFAKDFGKEVIKMDISSLLSKGGGGSPMPSQMGSGGGMPQGMPMPSRIPGQPMGAQMGAGNIPPELLQMIIAILMGLPGAGSTQGGGGTNSNISQMLMAGQGGQ